jgi:hypothetical protein
LFGKSACFTQHCAWVSFVVQFDPLQTLPFPCEPANTSSTVETAHDDPAALTCVEPPQLRILLSSHW